MGLQTVKKKNPKNNYSVWLLSMKEGLDGFQPYSIYLTEEFVGFETPPGDSPTLCYFGVSVLDPGHFVWAVAFSHGTTSDSQKQHIC